jgi:hypothetical protein
VCCVFFFFVLCTQCCHFLWIVHFWLPLWYSLTFIVNDWIWDAPCLIIIITNPCLWYIKRVLNYTVNTTCLKILSTCKTHILKVTDMSFFVVLIVFHILLIVFNYVFAHTFCASMIIIRN